MAADPLDAYIASKQQPAGADPLDAYIASKQGGEPAPPMRVEPKSFSQSDEQLGIDDGMIQPSIKADVLGMAHSPQEAAQRRGQRPQDPMEADPIAQGVVGGVLGAGGGAALEAGAGAAGMSAGLGRLFGLAGEGAINNGTQGGDPLVGGGLGMLLGSGGMLGKAVRGSKGAQARQFIEDRGGSVGLTSPGKGPVFDSMDVEGNTAADIGDQARRSGERVESGLNDYKKKVATDPYMAEVNKIPLAAAKAHRVDMDPIISNFREAVASEQDPAVRASLQAQLDTIEQTAHTNSQGMKLYSESALNDLRQVMGRNAKVGESSAAKLSPLKDAYGTVKAEVDKGPFAPANKVFSEGMTDYEDSLNKLDLKKNKKAGPNEANINKVRIKAQRKGQNNVTAGADRTRADEFSDKHPELGLELDRPELLRKQAELSFRAGAGSHGGLIEATKEASIPAAMAIAASGMGHGQAGLTGLLALLAAKNATPLAGRVLYKPAQAAINAADSKVLPRLLYQAARGGSDQ